MISWDYFKRVRRLQVELWMKAHNLNSYESFFEYLKMTGVTPPPKVEVSHLFPVVKFKPVIQVEQVYEVTVAGSPSIAEPIVIVPVTKKKRVTAMPVTDPERNDG